MSHPPKQSLNDYIAMVDAGRKAPALTPAEMQARLDRFEDQNRELDLKLDYLLSD